jgi:diguanylate cyclase (GGDEF)-like protein
MTTVSHNADANARPSHPESSSSLLAGDATQRIMVVDDEPVNGMVMQHILENAGYRNIEVIEDPRRVMDRIAADPPAVLLLDIMMPRVSGLDILRELGQRPNPDYLPVLVNTANADGALKQQALDLGATDFLTKPIDSRELLARVRNCLTIKSQVEALHRMTSKLDQQVREKTHELAESNKRLARINEQLSQEAEENRSLAQRLRHLASHDALTGLPNRVLLSEHITRCIERTSRQQGYQFALLYLDLDSFKAINDTHGHGCGDAVLSEVGRRLSSDTRPLDNIGRLIDDIPARLGGDEFVVLLDGLAELDDAMAVAKRISAEIAKPIEYKGISVQTGACIGIASSRFRYTGPDQVLSDADTALYAAKAAGSGTIIEFDQAQRDKKDNRQRLEDRLVDAVTNEEFFLEYQPVVSLITGEIEGFEALLRWHDAQYGVRMPDGFMAAAENAGVLNDLMMWVVDDATEALAELNAVHQTDALTMGLNVTWSQVTSPTFQQALADAVSRTDVRPSQICLEIPEADLMANSVEAATCIRDIGHDIWINDFGVGPASLTLLGNVPVAALRIDRSVICSLEGDRTQSEFVDSARTAAHHGGIRVVATGVETFEQLVRLQSLDCDAAQGYFFSRPMHRAEAVRLLRRKKIDWQARSR